MSHSTVTVVVEHATTPNEAFDQAVQMLAPYDEDLGSPQMVRVSHDEVAEILAESEDPKIQGLSPLSPTGAAAQPSAQTDILARVAQYKTGDPTCGAYNNHTGEYGYITSYNPDGRWDWYMVGGRWQGFYLIKDNVAPENYLLGDPGVMTDNSAESLKGRADVIRKRDIDIDAMRSLAGMKAHAVYDAYEEATKGIEPPEPWSITVARILERHVAKLAVRAAGASMWPLPPKGVEGMSEFEADKWAMSVLALMDADARSEVGEVVKLARMEFNNHPWVRALGNADLLSIMGDSPHLKFAVGAGGRDALVTRHSDEALTTLSLLSKEGWSAQGRISMFASVNPDMTEAEWARQFNEYIDGLADDAWLVLVDMHC